MKFSQIKTLALVALGIKSLDATALTAEQKETLTGAFGEGFTTKFESALTESDPETKSTELHSAMKAFFAPQAEEASAALATQLTALKAENEKQKTMIATLLNSAEEIPAPETNNNRGIGTALPALKINASADHYAAVFAAINAGSFGVAESSTIDVKALKTEFGAYLSQGTTNLNIVRQLFNGFTSAPEFRTVTAITEYRALQAQINSVVQKFSSKWTPKGNAKFTPLTIKNRRHKINVPIIPADVLDSYLLHLYDESLSPDQMPITKYYIQELLMPRISDDIELRMIFKGKYVENTDPNVATDPEESMDGIETILITEKAKASSKINFFTQTINWVTATDKQVIDFINAFADFVDDKLKIKKIYASKFVKKRYQRAYENLYGVNNKVLGGLNKAAEVDFVDMVVANLDGMADSPIIFATSPGNMVKLQSKNTPPNIINDVQVQDYEVKIFGEFWLGVGFEIAELTFAYVPEDYTDAQTGLKPSNQFPDGTTPAVDAGSGSVGGGI